MDAFRLGENSNSTPRFQCCLPKIKNLFRIIEILAILVFITSASARLPFAVKITGEYLRQLISVVVSPLFIFLLGNVIVFTLFFKSRPQHEHSQISVEAHLQFCQEFIRNGDDQCTRFAHESSFEPEQVVTFQDKQTIVEVTKMIKSESSEKLRRADEGDLKEDDCNSCEKELHRLEAEKRRRVRDGGEVEELSSEEFQRAIEAFIAKQIKFHQEEKVAIVLHGHA